MEKVGLEPGPLADSPRLGLAAGSSADADLAGQQVLILANPRAGAGESPRRIERLVRRLRDFALTPVVCTTPEQLTDRMAADGARVRCVVAAGGDGTVLEAINRAAGHPLALLPLGTENLTARHFGMGRNPEILAGIIAVGKVRCLDLARANGRTFCLMAGIGFDAEVVRQVHRRRRGHITRWAYALPILQTLRDYPFPPVTIEIEETGERLQGAMVFVFNVPRYGLELPIPLDAQPDDGLLDLYVYEKPDIFSLGFYVFRTLQRRHTQMADVHHRQVRRVTLSSDQPVPFQLDGDPAGTLPVRIEVVPGGLRLMVASA